ncbi:hypothetical protein [Thauera sp.]|jgi:hypothetical protein|uniref:hypothetical protein n=1 Tax=Thauera sp. TaxID=1905334 RepID=UPI00263A3A89|nr:hypothetical protein [Thauera sp.]
MIRRLTAAATALLLASACATPYSPTPLATNFETSKQQKLQAASHWNTIARDVADRLSARLQPGSKLFVNQHADATSFERAFSAQLATALVDAGHLVMRSPEGAMRVGVDTQTVPFAADRPQYRYAGAATALAGGVWVLYDIVEYASNGPAKAAVATVAAADAAHWFRSEFASGETPALEIIVNTSVTDASRFVARTTNVYYVADTDQHLYVPEKPDLAPQLPVKTFQIVGGQ